MNEVLDAMMAVKADPRRVNQSKEISNGAGKTINMLKLAMEYAGRRGEKPEIPFIRGASVTGLLTDGGNSPTKKDNQ